MTITPDHEVTRLLHERAGGNDARLPPLMDLVYPEWHRLAARSPRPERSGDPLEPAELVHEACLRLAPQLDKGLRVPASTVTRAGIVDNTGIRRDVPGEGRRDGA
jgi:hypothetical protein